MSDLVTFAVASTPPPRASRISAAVGIGFRSTMLPQASRNCSGSSRRGASSRACLSDVGTVVPIGLMIAATSAAATSLFA